MEHLFAYSSGTTFKGHRGDKFCKAIRITTSKQLSFVVKVGEDSEMELTVCDRRTEVEFDTTRTITIVWINVAHPDATVPIKANVDTPEYVRETIRSQLPEVVLITSTGSAFNAGHLKSTLKALKNTAAYTENVGRDRGVACFSCRESDGEMWQDVDRGNNIERGVVVHFNWHL